MLRGVKQLFTPVLNTVQEDEIVNIIQYSGDEPDGVKVFSQIPGERENNLKVGGDSFKMAFPEPVEDDSQKIQGGNGQGKSSSHPLDEFLKGFEGALL